ncbi:uncharacterized protein LOC123715375 [Pieris brassicae]|uniref:Uncharacterized protein n=1 Tax=Pieris brassicae TaxID=7116 RepID=A0A9P0TMG8_PIEBR|nr:uncharacterized protein LOC123715375 [Pieris brassicae]CAH4032637.1 unnamed protein product [Pieris brassicae]
MNSLLLFFVQCVLLKESLGMPAGNGYQPYGMNDGKLPYPQNSYSPIVNEGINDMYIGHNGNNYGNNLLENPASNLVHGMQNPAINNIQVSPVISEVVPSLQYGDINMAGELPIGGTIKVSGCFPVYGMVAVDGNVPSSGSAVVAESFGNQVMDVVSKCASQYFSS